MKTNFIPVGFKALLMPKPDVYTLQNLQPGKAYYVLMSTGTNITFPGCTKSGAASTQNHTNASMLEIIGKSPWSQIARTGISHRVAIPEQVITTSLIRQGDYLGAFDWKGNCFGLIRWDGATTSMVVFGDDPTTAEKVGFNPAEPLFFRMYIATTGKEYSVEVTWDSALPQHDGAFSPNGLSAIASLNMGATQVADPGRFDVLIYPNPASEVIFVDLVSLQQTEASITDMHGREVLRQSLTALRSQIGLTSLQSGIYLIKIEGSNFTKIEKVIKK